MDEVKAIADIVYRKEFREAKAELGCYVNQADFLRIELKQYLLKRGIKRLFKFQEDAIKAILKGRDVVIVAPTGMGKTEAFIIPVVQKIIELRGAWGLLKAKARKVYALLIYPTKALARDQLKKFKEIERLTGISFEVLDGDTPQHKREQLLKNPSDVLITNPDMLHSHLHGKRLKELFINAKFVVLDEIHEYVGSFGTNVHFILKRLERFTNFQVIGASATIANPKEFASLLFGRDVEVVECKKGRKAKTHFLIVKSEEKSATGLAAELLKILIKNNFKTIVFANTHKGAEITYRIAKNMDLRVAIHRAGLPAKYRRGVEEDFRHGRIKAIVATPTLELGIDIGDVDAVISLMTSFTRMIQRIGRAGRRGQESIALLVLKNNDPISSYYAENPEDYFADIDPAYVEPNNDVVAYYQILAASLDKPLLGNEFAQHKQIVEKLTKEGLLRKVGNLYYPNYKKARKIVDTYNIRGIGETVLIKEEAGKVIGERQMPMAARELYEGAIYLHAGDVYASKEFYFEKGKGYAIVEKLPEDFEYKTEALHYTEPKIAEVLEEKQLYASKALYCKLNMKQIVYGYVVKDIYSNRTHGTYTLDKEIVYSFDTMGFVISLPTPKDEVEKYLYNEELPADLDDYEKLLAGAFHANEHVLIEGSSMFTGGGSAEIGGVAMGHSGIIFVYDGMPGGSGLSKLLYKHLEESIKRSLFILENCKCKRIDGCPACTYSYQCGNNNKPLFKYGAIEAFKLLIKGEKPEVSLDEYELYHPYV